MSVVRLSKEPQPKPRPNSGGAMDKPVERRGLPRKALWVLIAFALIAVAAAAWFLAPSASTQRVPMDRLTIAAVRQGVFEDYLPIRARVTPLVTVYLDAVEGGRVERKLVEEGAFVRKGQPLAVLSNAELQLSTLARQTEVEQQLNNMRSQELALSQTRVSNQRDIILADLEVSKLERLHTMQSALAEKGFVAQRVFRDTQDDLRQQRQRLAVLKAGAATDERLQSSQLAQLRASAASMRQGLGIARSNLDQLSLKAPVDGRLTSFAIQLGQSLQRGERIGQIDSPGANKVVAGVDEFYLGRITIDQRASVEVDGRSYALRVTRISPQVRNGEFEVELQFTGPEPAGISRGQTLQARLTLSDPRPALIVPNGAFYNDTGGNWAFVVAPDGRSAEKRNLRLGRRSQSSIEVLDGLSAGERIITSPYTGLSDKERLALEP